jgi:uncharacterized membrane protein (UPF0127 family)
MRGLFFFLSCTVLLSRSPGILAAELYREIRLPTDQVILAEVVQSREARALGLQHREQLEAGRGMLFVMPHEGPHTFWMKNMRLDLDIIFIDAEQRVLHCFDFVKAPAPGSPEYELPRVQGMGKYVLEVPAGSCQQLEIQVGDTLRF